MRDSCSRNHAYNATNTVRDRHGKRVCKICARERKKLHQAKSQKKYVAAPMPYIPIPPRIYTPHVDQSHEEWLRFHSIKKKVEYPK